jgi:hypothetical protein
MKKQLSIMTLALGAGFAMPAVAQLHVAQANPPSIMKANPAVAPAPGLPDVSKVVSKANAESFAAAEFAFADSDKNAKLTKAEFEAFDKARKDKEKEKIAAMNEPAPAGATPPTGTPTGALTPAPAAASLESPGTAQKTADAQYTEIVGKAAAIDKKMLVDARLAAFIKADTDVNGFLSSSESAKFADLVSGKSAL